MAYTVQAEKSPGSNEWQWRQGPMWVEQHAIQMARETYTKANPTRVLNERGAVIWPPPHPAGIDAVLKGIEP